ncbi:MULTISPECIES: hypothetical protein [unclassified Nesterenkonia]|uniref:hypothetical protein n=1 Tax=unclassified Nesterenkonia TaxID=2629769 RepID=UPI0021051C96|nr:MULTISPECIES: hypothetical protein [unclassified Nesterenkonia]
MKTFWMRLLVAQAPSVGQDTIATLFFGKISEISGCPLVWRGISVSMMTASASAWSSSISRTASMSKVASGRMRSILVAEDTVTSPWSSLRASSVKDCWIEFTRRVGSPGSASSLIWKGFADSGTASGAP